MKIKKYKTYDDYKKAQTRANKKKLGLIWVRPEVVDEVCKRVGPSPTFGLCHGTRRGVEQELFKQLLGCPVLGTEISLTAEQFPNTIQWDFHDVKPEWIGACDFIYTNSLDHARYPRMALESWLSCLEESGILAIEWTEKLRKGKPKKSTETDPFSATTQEICDLIEECGGEVTEVIRVDGKTRTTGHHHKAVLIFARRIS